MNRQGKILSLRRDFIKTMGLTASAWLLPGIPLIVRLMAMILFYSSKAMEIKLSSTAPEIINFNIDGLAKSKWGISITKLKASKNGYQIMHCTR